MKCRIVLEVETRPFTSFEMLAEGERDLTPDDLEDPDPRWLADQIAEALENGSADEMIFAGSDLFHKIAAARPVNAMKVP